MAPTDYSNDSGESEYSESQQPTTNMRPAAQTFDGASAALSPQVPPVHHQHTASYLPPYVQPYGETDSRYVPGQSLSDFYFLQSPGQSPDLLRQQYASTQPAAPNDTNAPILTRVPRGKAGVNKSNHSKRRSRGRRFQSADGYYGAAGLPPAADELPPRAPPAPEAEQYAVSYGSPGPPAWRDEKGKEGDDGRRFGLGIGIPTSIGAQQSAEVSYDGMPFPGSSSAARGDAPAVYVHPPDGKDHYKRPESQPAYELPRPGFTTHQPSPGGLTPALGLRRERFEGYAYDAYANGAGVPGPSGAPSVAGSSHGVGTPGTAAPLMATGVRPVLPSPVTAYSPNEYAQQVALANYGAYAPPPGSRVLVPVPGDDREVAYEVAQYAPEPDYEYGDPGAVRVPEAASPAGNIYGYYDARYARAYASEAPPFEEDSSEVAEGALLMTVPGPNYSNEASTVEWTEEQVYDLMRLLEHGERHKWKYMSEILTECQNKRISMRACKSKFEAMFGETEAASLLRSSLFYTAYRTGWETIRQERTQAERAEMTDPGAGAADLLARTDSGDVAVPAASSDGATSAEGATSADA